MRMPSGSNLSFATYYRRLSKDLVNFFKVVKHKVSNEMDKFKPTKVQPFCYKILAISFFAFTFHLFSCRLSTFLYRWNSRFSMGNE